jgi:hypothetical protein
MHGAPVNRCSGPRDFCCEPLNHLAKVLTLLMLLPFAPVDVKKCMWLQIENKSLFLLYDSLANNRGVAGLGRLL